MPGTTINLIIIIVVTMIVSSIWGNRKKLMKLRKSIGESWGKQGTQKYSDDDLNLISSYFRNTREINSNDFYIDDITWNDLGMDEVYKRINSNHSSVGEEYLYNMLRTPKLEVDSLKKIDELAEFFNSNEKERFNFSFSLARLGKNRSACISDFFNREWSSSNKLLYYRGLSSLPLISVGLFFINTGLAILLLFSSLATNLYIHLKQSRENEYQMRRFNYLITAIRCADKILKMDVENVNKHFDGIKDSVNKLKSLKNAYFNISENVGELDMIFDYIRMFLLSDVITIERLNSTIGKNNDDLKVIYNFLGAVDSAITIASYRVSLSYFTKPTFLKGNEEKYLRFEEIYHPLISNPVSNSCNVEKSLLITGSNASGKSTFLKTVAINSILAQTIFTCLARVYKSSFFKTYTSMALKDDLMEKESYYIVEIKSLKRILESIDENVPSLCFIDEILRGTNTVERISASSEVLNSLAKSNCISLSATHDVELTSILSQVFENYHFQEKIVGDEIIFDYKLYPGRTVTRNAIKLLSIMGYENSIVSRAEERAQKFLKEGIWLEV